MCSRHLQKHFSGPMIGLTGKPTGKLRKTYCLQPREIAMQAQISARASFSATKVGRHAAVPPFHILLVFHQLHFFFSWLEAPIHHPNIATCCCHDQLSSNECKSVRSKVVSIDGRFDRQKSIRSKTSISSIEDCNYCLSLN